MNTRRVSLVPASLLCLVTLLVAALAAGPVRAQPVLLIASNGNDMVGKYNAVTGATINANFISISGATYLGLIP